MGLPPSSSQEPVGVADTSATSHRFAMLSLGWRRSFKGSWSFEKRADRWGSLQVARKSQLESPTHLPRSIVLRCSLWVGEGLLRVLGALKNEQIDGAPSK